MDSIYLDFQNYVEMMLSSSKVWVYTHHPHSLLVDPPFSDSNKSGYPVNPITFSTAQGNVFTLKSCWTCSQKARGRWWRRNSWALGNRTRPETLQLCLKQGFPIFQFPLPCLVRQSEFQVEKCAPCAGKEIQLSLWRGVATFKMLTASLGR